MLKQLWPILKGNIGYEIITIRHLQNSRKRFSRN